MDGPTPIAEMMPHVAAAGPHAGIGFREFVSLIAALMALTALGIDMMLPALPQIAASFGVVNENERQWIITAFVTGFGGATLFYGPISDRYGRKKLMLGGIVGYALCSLAITVAPSFTALLVLRAMQGVSIASTRVVATSLVRDCYGGRQMARVMSLATMVFLAVPILAPSLGQLIMIVLPWQGLFALLAVYAAAIFTWVVLRLPETLHPDYRRPIDLGTVLAGIRITLTDRLSCGYTMAQAVLQGALLGFIASIGQVFEDVFHAPRLMPPVFALIATGIGLASLLNSRFVERLGTRRIGHAAIILMTLVEVIHLLVALAGHETIWSFAAFQTVALFCFGLSSGNFSAIAMEPLAALAGTAASVQSFVLVFGGSLLGIVIGQQFDGTTVPLSVGFALSGVIAVACILFAERGRLFHPHMGM